MKYFLLQILVVTIIPLVIEGNHAPLSYEFSKCLHAKYNLYWNNPTDGKICMAVEVETLGWVGLGFSPNGDMVDSDIMMAWVINGEVNITDRFAVSMSLPVLDSQQDFELVEGYEEDGRFNHKYQLVLRHLLVHQICLIKQRKYLSVFPMTGA